MHAGTDRMMNLIMKAAANLTSARQAPRYQYDITTSRRQQKILLSTAYTILSLREQLVRGQSLISRAPRSVSVGCFPKLSVGLELSAPLLWGGTSWGIADIGVVNKELSLQQNPRVL